MKTIVDKRSFKSAEIVEPKCDDSQVERGVMLHSYRSAQGCKICSKCGTAKHSREYDGYKYWFAGVGYEQEPLCRTAT